MTSYIYLSSDTKLTTTKITKENSKSNQARIYFSPASMESFCFESNFDAKNQECFSYSKHFSDKKYQVASVGGCLPDENCKRLSPQNKKALHELFNYIQNHFKNSKATYVEVLYCLDCSKDGPLKEELLVSSDGLSVDDLYYKELKFVRIESQKTAFVYRRRTA